MNPIELPKKTVKLSFEIATAPLRASRWAAGLAIEKVSDSYAQAIAGGSEIVERIQSEIPVTEAKVAAQYVVIAEKIDPDDCPTVEERQKSRTMRKGLLRLGHSHIAKTAIAAETDPAVNDEIVQEVISIAHQVGTEPLRLSDDDLSEHERYQADRIINPPTKS